MDIKLVVATHKSYWMPNDSAYYPVYVGASGKRDIGYTRDDTGENISNKNKNYCELTGLYWAWKNINADYMGLVHYRRHFIDKSKSGSKNDRVIRGEALEALLNDNDVLLPNPRNYFIESNYSQYVHAHHAIDLDTARTIIQDKYPDYLKVYDSYMKRTIGHRFNMFVMKKEIFNAYCTWLFDILFELERRLDVSNYSDYDARVFGFVSERLLDVWIETNNISYKNIPYAFMEKQNWAVKICNFLMRKIKKADE